MSQPEIKKNVIVTLDNGETIQARNFFVSRDRPIQGEDWAYMESLQQPQHHAKHEYHTWNLTAEYNLYGTILPNEHIIKVQSDPNPT